MLTLTAGKVILFMLVSFLTGGNLCIVFNEFHYNNYTPTLNILGLIGGLAIMAYIIILLLLI